MRASYNEMIPAGRQYTYNVAQKSPVIFGPLPTYAEKCVSGRFIASRQYAPDRLMAGGPKAGELAFAYD